MRCGGGKTVFKSCARGPSPMRHDGDDGDDDAHPGAAVARHRADSAAAARIYVMPMYAPAR